MTGLNLVTMRILVFLAQTFYMKVFTFNLALYVEMPTFDSGTKK